MMMHASEQSIRSPAELGLFRALAIATLHRLRMLLPCEKSVGADGECYVHHMYGSDLEIACGILWELGVSRGAFAHGRGPINFSYEAYCRPDSGGKGFPPYFSLPRDDEAERLLDRMTPTAWPSIERVIEAYLRVATDYGANKEWHLPTPRGQAFRATHPSQIAPLEAFVLNGYARKVGGEYLWSDKMLPTIGEIWLWDETDADLSGVDAQKVEEQVTAILASLSEITAGRSHLDLHLSVTFRALEILKYWDGGKWSESSVAPPVLTFDEAVAISQNLEQELQAQLAASLILSPPNLL